VMRYPSTYDFRSIRPSTRVQLHQQPNLPTQLDHFSTISPQTHKTESVRRDRFLSVLSPLKTNMLCRVLWQLQSRVGSRSSHRVQENSASGRYGAVQSSPDKPARTF
jgi:hypothetical protein